MRCLVNGNARYARALFLFVFALGHGWVFPDDESTGAVRFRGFFSKFLVDFRDMGHIYVYYPYGFRNFTIFTFGTSNSWSFLWRRREYVFISYFCYL